MFSLLQLAANTFQSAFHFLTCQYFKQTEGTHLKSLAMKHVVILGASYGGIGTAHRIFKQRAKTGPFKITLVSPNTDMFWNMAAARGVVPGKLTDDQLFQPIAAGFKQFPATQFEFIVASAESLDVEGKRVTLSTNQVLDYDFLVIATGTRTKEPTPFKGLSNTAETKNALHDFQAKVKKAETIVIAGGGVTGCETAGELAAEYGTGEKAKKIILVSVKKSSSNVNYCSSYADRQRRNCSS